MAKSVADFLKDKKFFKFKFRLIGGISGEERHLCCMKSVDFSELDNAAELRGCLIFVSGFLTDVPEPSSIKRLAEAGAAALLLVATSENAR